MSETTIKFPTEIIEEATINGESNLLYDFLQAIAAQRSQVTWCDVADSNFQCLIVTEATIRGVCERKGFAYWDEMWKLAEMATAANCSLENVFLAFRASTDILTENVPLGLPGATYLDENEETVNRTFADWFQNTTPSQGIKDLGDGTALFLTSALGDRLNATQMMVLKAYADANPSLNMVWLNTPEYKELKP